MNLGGFDFVWIAVAGAVSALVLIAIGIVRAVLAIGVLNKRLAGYADLPILTAIERTQFRVALMTRRLEEIDTLRARAEAALEQIRLQLTVIRSVFAPLSKAIRTPGN